MFASGDSVGEPRDSEDHHEHGGGLGGSGQLALTPVQIADGELAAIVLPSVEVDVGEARAQVGGAAPSLEPHRRRRHSGAGVSCPSPT